MEFSNIINISLYNRIFFDKDLVIIIVYSNRLINFKKIDYGMVRKK